MSRGHQMVTLRHWLGGGGGWSGRDNVILLQEGQGVRP